MSAVTIPYNLVDAFASHYHEYKFDEADKVLNEFYQAAFLNKDGRLLGAAAAEGDLRKVRFLLRHHVDVDQPYYGSPPVHDAIKNGHVDVVRELLAHGAHASAKALRLASECGNKAIIDLLLENGAKVNRKNSYTSPLYLACTNGHYEACVSLVEHGAVLQHPCCVTSPLHAAAAKGHDAIVSYLIDKKADCNLATPNGITPLYLACKNNKTSTAKLLCEKGARPDFKIGWREEDPLRLAAENDNEELFHFFVARGADIDKKDYTLYAKNRIYTFLVEREKKLTNKWWQEKIAFVKSFFSPVCDSVSSIFRTHSEHRQCIQKHKRAYNVLKGGRSVTQITQEEAQAVIYSLAVERKRNTVETVLKAVTKLSRDEKTALVRVIENKALLDCTPLCKGLNEQHKARLERLRKVLVA